MIPPNTSVDLDEIAASEIIGSEEINMIVDAVFNNEDDGRALSIVFRNPYYSARFEDVFLRDTSQYQRDDTISDNGGTWNIVKLGSDGNPRQSMVIRYEVGKQLLVHTSQNQGTTNLTVDELFKATTRAIETLYVTKTLNAVIKEQMPTEGLEDTLAYFKHAAVAATKDIRWGDQLSKSQGPARYVGRAVRLLNLPRYDTFLISWRFYMASKRFGPGSKMQLLIQLHENYPTVDLVNPQDRGVLEMVRYINNQRKGVK